MVLVLYCDLTESGFCHESRCLASALVKRRILPELKIVEELCGGLEVTSANKMADKLDLCNRLPKVSVCAKNQNVAVF